MNVAEAIANGYEVGDQDLLATLVGNDVAALVLEKFGSFQRLSRAGIAELRELKGVGARRATQLKAVVEFARRIYHKPLERGDMFTSPQDVARSYGALLKGRHQETFWAILLDCKNRVLKHVQVSVGSTESCPVDPRDVFRHALKEGASSLILLHNHPSGDPAPSSQDADLTDRFCRAGELLNIKVLDHVIVADDGFHSFAEHGQI